MMSNEYYKIYPVGFIQKKESLTIIEVDEKYTDAILGLNKFSHIMVYFWFHKNDTLEQRNILQVYPRKNKNNPLSGVFATHSNVRPNLIGMSFCKIVSVNKNIIQIDEIDAFDETPVLDIKPFIPSSKAFDVKVPEWV